MSELEELSRLVFEFYNTREEVLRKELQSTLNRYQESTRLHFYTYKLVCYRARILETMSTGDMLFSVA